MPTIVNPQTGEEQTVSEGAFRRMENAVGEGTLERILQPTVPLDPSKSSKHAHLWDCIDQTWAGPFPKDRISDYIQKQVVRCSACSFTSNTIYWHQDGSVGTHVNLVKEQAAAHKDATLSEPILSERGVGSQICSGCGYPFQVGRGAEHINRLRNMGLSHGYVEAHLINKFAMTPSEPLVIAKQVVADGPVTRQVEPDAPPRKRRRRNRRKRGNSD